jgi:two-component system cell cycle response regulator DivK
MNELPALREPVVLLVEDNERNLKLARDVLEFSGFIVRVATSGEDAVSQAMTSPPDLILMDLQLPGIDGNEALARLRGDPGTSGIPVVALTAFAMREDRERALGAGFDGYLEKPISVRSFPDQVRAHLRSENAS